MNSINGESNNNYISSEIKYGLLVGRSVEDMYNNMSLKSLSIGSHDMMSLTNNIQHSTGSIKPLSLFVLPNTLVEITYKDGTFRTVTNMSTTDDVICIDGLNISNVNVIPHEQNHHEHFVMDSSGITFSYYDILILLILILIFFYLLR